MPHLLKGKRDEDHGDIDKEEAHKSAKALFAVSNIFYFNNSLKASRLHINFT